MHLYNEFHRTVKDHLFKSSNANMTLFTNKEIMETYSKFYITPRRLLRGIVLSKEYFDKHESFQESKGCISYTTSIQIAKNFAQGTSNPSIEYTLKDKIPIGIVYNYCPDKDDIIFAIGKFIRKHNYKFTFIPVIF